MTLAGLARRHRGELVRFVLVGTLSALINTAVIIALTELLGIYFLVSHAICFLTVTLLGFVLNRRWTFALEGSAHRRELGRYYLVNTIATLLAMASSRIMVALGLPYGIAVFLAAGLLAPFNFVAHRFFSFKPTISG